MVFRNWHEALVSDSESGEILSREELYDISYFSMLGSIAVIFRRHSISAQTGRAVNLLKSLP